MRLSVVIPAYNEEQAIGAAITAVFDFLTNNNFGEPEVIVVDDGSSDQTGAVVADYQKKYSALKYVKNTPNRGKGFSVKQGVLAATGDYILFLDADLSTPITELKKVWPFAQEKTIVVGSRALPESVIVKHQAKLKELVARLGNLLIQLCLGLRISDTQCGFKLFPASIKSVFTVATIERWGFDMEILFLAKHQGFTIKEVPITWTNDPSSLVRGKDYLVVLADIGRILTRWFLGRYTAGR